MIKTESRLKEGTNENNEERTVERKCYEGSQMKNVRVKERAMKKIER